MDTTLKKWITVVVVGIPQLERVNKMEGLKELLKAQNEFIKSIATYLTIQQKQILKLTEVAEQTAEILKSLVDKRGGKHEK